MRAISFIYPRLHRTIRLRKTFFTRDADENGARCLLAYRYDDDRKDLAGEVARLVAGV
jgi:hypothetical protein